MWPAVLHACLNGTVEVGHVHAPVWERVRGSLLGESRFLPRKTHPLVPGLPRHESKARLPVPCVKNPA